MDAPRSALGRRSGARKRSAGARPPPWSAGRLVTPAFPIRHSREGENPRTIGTHRDDTRETTNHVRTETPVNPPQTCPDPRYGAGVLEWGEENVARSKTTRGEGLVPRRGQPAGRDPPTTNRRVFACIEILFGTPTQPYTDRYQRLSNGAQPGIEAGERFNQPMINEPLRQTKEHADSEDILRQVIGEELRTETR